MPFVGTVRWYSPEPSVVADAQALRKRHVLCRASRNLRCQVFPTEPTLGSNRRRVDRNGCAGDSASASVGLNEGDREQLIFGDDRRPINWF